MIKIFRALFLFILVSCSAEKIDEVGSLYKLTVNPRIDRESSINQEIIETLKQFWESKNNSYFENEYWHQPDFERFYYPYMDIYEIEKKDSLPNFYQPTLMEIVNTDEEHKKLLKIAFIGHDELTKENVLKSIYNIIAAKGKNGILFSNPLDYFTKDWTKIKRGSVEYVISPQKTFSEAEANRQLEDINKISNFYGTSPLSITYYSCVDVKEMFQIKGFDYNPMMYVEGGGGLSAHRNIVFSGNSSETYTHEVVHLYNFALSSRVPMLLNEGMATYVGGSRIYSYSWHKNNLKKYLEANPETDLSKHLEPFERFFAGETSIPYMIGALICERTFRLYGKETLFTLLIGQGEFWELIRPTGLTKENLDIELKKELQLSPTLCL